eukprot:9195665-Heterocapsa_arctica.AAC.1
MRCSGSCWTARPRCCTTNRSAAGDCGTPWASFFAAGELRRRSSGALPATWCTTCPSAGQRSRRFSRSTTSSATAAT